jgi:cytosine/adenosine deaminase-related metal-dependent hydrolase
MILRATTLDNATALGLSHELGSIEVGKRADLLLLRKNPLANVSAYDSIETIFLDGEPIVGEALRAHKRRAPHNPMGGAGLSELRTRRVFTQPAGTHTM